MDGHFSGIGYWKFIVFLWSCPISLIIGIYCFLVFVFVHLMQWLHFPDFINWLP